MYLKLWLKFTHLSLPNNFIYCIAYIHTRMKGIKTGGRKKGTANKLTSKAKKLMEAWLDLHNSRQSPDSEKELIWEDFDMLSPQERMRVTVDFMKIILPKTVNVDTEEKRITIEERLSALADGIDPDKEE